jgi:hypothetical protein
MCACEYIHVRGLEVEFPDWCEKRNKTYKEIKNKYFFFLFKVFSAYVLYY